MVGVVGAAIVRDGRLLAARRTAPPELAGRWELPGGKVEPGESPDSALRREVAEELGCAIEVTRWLATSVPIDGARVLTVALARITRGEPRPVEHDAVCWLDATELESVDWLPADRPFLTAIRAALVGDHEEMRGIFFEEAQARSVAEQLVREGFEVSVVRERLAGEDDDLDHPWAVLTDAPRLRLELLVDQYDGWLDAD
jgi:8-oxo-dGTP diphosphatase